MKHSPPSSKRMRSLSKKVCKAPDCENRFTPHKSTEKVCSIQCAIKLAKHQREKKALRDARISKREWYEANETVQQLIKKVQRYHFNPYIRERDKDKKCISCGVSLRGRKFDAGHYYPTTRSALRFCPENVWGQCVKCNQFLHGNLAEYRKGLLKRIGADEMAKLDQMAHESKKWTREELRELMERYPRPKRE